MSCLQEFECITGNAFGHDYHSKAVDSEGNEYVTNRLLTIARHTRVCAPEGSNYEGALSFVKRLGYGFTVFDLGRVPVPASEIPALTARMAASLDPATPRGTIVHLLRVNEQDVSFYQADAATPKLLLVIWAGCPADSAQALHQHVLTEIELMHAREATMRDDDLELQRQFKAMKEDNGDSLTGWYEDFRTQFADPQLPEEQVFTYEKIVQHELYLVQIRAAQEYRRKLAAQMVLSSELMSYSNEAKTRISKLFTPGKQQLYMWFDESTTQMKVLEHCILYCENYNLCGNNSAVVFHSPSRGADIYMRAFDQEGDLNEFERANIVTQPGAPAHSPLKGCFQHSAPSLLQNNDDGTRKLSPEFNTMVGEAKQALAAQQAPWVEVSPGSFIEGTNIEGTKFVTIDQWEGLYSTLHPLQYAKCFACHEVLHCSAVVCILPSPMEFNGKLYGVEDLKIQSLIHHAHPCVLHYMIPYSNEWITQLASSDSVRGIHELMCRENAVCLENSDRPVAYRVKCQLLDPK